MKTSDIAKGIQSYDKRQIGAANQLSLAELQDAESQEAMETSVEGLSGGEGIIDGIQVLPAAPTDLYQGRIWMEVSP